MPKKVEATPFLCDHPGCNKAYSSSQNLSRHRTIHGLPHKPRGGVRRGVPKQRAAVIQATPPPLAKPHEQRRPVPPVRAPSPK